MFLEKKQKYCTFADDIEQEATSRLIVKETDDCMYSGKAFSGT